MIMTDVDTGQAAANGKPFSFVSKIRVGEQAVNGPHGRIKLFLPLSSDLYSSVVPFLVHTSILACAWHALGT
jgi:hypothetical protein